MPPATDAQLVERCLAGESSAWQVIVDRYLGLVIGLSRRAGLETTAAEDIAQEVFLALWKHLPRLHSHERLQGWIAQSARRASWRARKRDRARVARDTKIAQGLERGHPGIQAAEDPLAVQIEEEQRHLVRQGLDSLDARCRALLDALFLRDLESYAAVADDLGIPVGSIGPTRRRCLEHLLLDLEERGIRAGDVSAEPAGASHPIEGSSREKPSGAARANRRRTS